MEYQRGYLRLDYSLDERWIHVFMAGNYTDLLLLMALSKRLLSMIGCPPNVYKLDDTLTSHYDFINKLSKVSILFRIDLRQSLVVTRIQEGWR